MQVYTGYQKSFPVKSGSGSSCSAHRMMWRCASCEASIAMWPITEEASYKSCLTMGVRAIVSNDPAFTVLCVL